MIKTKKKLDWSNLGFQYHKTDFRFVAKYQEGKWDQGKLLKDEYISIHEGSTAIHYAQQCFEGMKAYSTKDGKILLFRPLENAKRMAQTAQRLLMPPIPEKLFLSGVEEVVRANYSWIPPFDSGASLYIRPILIGIGKNLGLKAALEYEFRIFTSPVGPYFPGGKLVPIKLFVTSYDRSSPNGIGSFKAGANYVAGFLASKEARENGATEALYLDPKENRYLDEAGSANIVVLMKNKHLVTPQSSTILPSITRRSVMELAANELKLKTEERPIDFFKEVKDFKEMGACGTAAIVSPVSEVVCKGKHYRLPNDGEEIGPIMKELFQLLTSIQKEVIPDSYNWLHEVPI